MVISLKAHNFSINNNPETSHPLVHKTGTSQTKGDDTSNFVPLYNEAYINTAQEFNAALIANTP